MREQSDHLAALLGLDPSYLTVEDRTFIHPAVRYQRAPWSGSTVSVFPAAANRRALAQYALEIVRGRRRGGVESAVMRRARDLHEMQVSRDAAIVELREYAAELSRFVELVRERQHAG